MQVIFGHWKYIFKNIWFVLPFALIPAVFFALSLDYSAIERLILGFFGGEERLSYMEIFYAWSIFRFNSLLGVIYGVCTLVSTVFVTAFMITLVEKHMRIGKRTLSGVSEQLCYQLLSVFMIVLLYFVLYEVWALVLSAMIYTVTAFGATPLAYVLFVFIIVLFFAVLLYLSNIFYLWLPCMQITGMRAYNALLYSYRLVLSVRGKLLLSMLISLVPVFAVVWAGAFLPDVVSVVISFFLFVFVYLSFVIRMETLYFETDKIDREDLIRSYREL